MHAKEVGATETAWKGVINYETSRTKVFILLYYHINKLILTFDYYKKLFPSVNPIKLKIM